MVPDKFNMVDMEGIDIIINQGVEIPGIYQKLAESIAQCRYQCLYNWYFDAILIPPTYVEMVVDPNNGNILINTGIYVTPEDVIMIVVFVPPDTGNIENITTGELTIETAVQRITIHHNLGKRPDVIALWGDFADGASIPYDCCIRCLYFRDPFTHPLWTKNSMHYLYEYRHKTSGNILSLSSSDPSSYFTSTIAECPRGIANWQPIDANGDPITYRWCAIKFKNYFGDN